MDQSDWFVFCCLVGTRSYGAIGDENANSGKYIQ